MNHYDKDQKLALLDEVEFTKYFKENSWSAYNQRFFNGLAAKYDALNVVLSLGCQKRFKRKAIGHLGLSRDAEVKILDVCTGSGDMALMMAKAFPKAQITALDFSEQMLVEARRKADKANCHDIRFIQGDAMQMPFKDQSFDVVFIGFGLRNLTCVEQGLQELARVAKPGAVVSSLDMGKPKGFLLKNLYHLHFETLIPFLGRHIFHRGEFNSFAYLSRSNRYFPGQDQLVPLFEQNGFEKVRNINYMFGAVAQQVGRRV